MNGRLTKYPTIDIYNIRTAGAFDRFARDSFTVSSPCNQKHIFVRDKFGIINLHVDIHISFLRNIDTSKQTFECTLVIRFKWQEYMNNEHIHHDEEPWKPDVSFGNVVSEITICYHKLDRTDLGNNICQVSYCLIVSGIFAEHFEIKQFPLDAQRLHMNMTLLNCPIISNQSIDGIDQQESMDPADKSNHPHVLTYIRKNNEYSFRLYRGDVSFATDNFIDFDSWKIIDYVSLLRTRTNPTFNPNDTSLCKLITFVTVGRKCEHYFWNIVFPLSLQVCLAHTTLFIMSDDIGTKTQITLTIILTIFAVKYTCTQYIPVVNQITYLDMYFIYCTFYVGLITLQNLCTYIFHDIYSESFTQIFNIISGSLFMGFWVISNTMVYGLMLSKSFRDRFIKITVEGDDSNENKACDQYVLYNDRERTKNIVERTNKYINVTVVTDDAPDIKSVSA